MLTAYFSNRYCGAIYVGIATETFDAALAALPGMDKQQLDRWDSVDRPARLVEGLFDRPGVLLWRPLIGTSRFLERWYPLEIKAGETIWTAIDRYKEAWQQSISDKSAMPEKSGGPVFRNTDERLKALKSLAEFQAAFDNVVLQSMGYLHSLPDCAIRREHQQLDKELFVLNERFSATFANAEALILQNKD